MTTPTTPRLPEYCAVCSKAAQNKHLHLSPYDSVSDCAYPGHSVLVHPAIEALVSALNAYYLDQERYGEVYAETGAGARLSGMSVSDAMLIGSRAAGKRPQLSDYLPAAPEVTREAMHPHRGLYLSIFDAEQNRHVTTFGPYERYETARDEAEHLHGILSTYMGRQALADLILVVEGVDETGDFRADDVIDCG